MADWPTDSLLVDALTVVEFGIGFIILARRRYSASLGSGRGPEVLGIVVHWLRRPRRSTTSDFATRRKSVLHPGHECPQQIPIVVLEEFLDSMGIAGGGDGHEQSCSLVLVATVRQGHAQAALAVCAGLMLICIIDLTEEVCDGCI